MHMKLAIFFVIGTSVDALRRHSKKAPSESGMLSDRGLVLSQEDEAQVHASGPDERFENQTHEAKMSQIWSKVMADTRISQLPSMWKAALDSLKMMAFNDFFDYHNDEKPRGQNKVIHMQAVACKFNMKVFASSPFTGIFKPGTTTGIMRMGPPAPQLATSGVSLKWFRSNVESGNTVLAAYERSENFFEHDLSNHIELFESAPLMLLRKIMQQTVCTAFTALSDIAMYDQDGNNAGDKVNFPFELRLESANRTLATMTAGKNYTTEVHKLLSAIPVGTKLYNVKVRAEPGAEFEQIGELSTASQCTNSMYADLRLAYQHRRMEDDLALRPEWDSLVRGVCDEHR